MNGTEWNCYKLQISMYKNGENYSKQWLEKKNTSTLLTTHFALLLQCR